jgi:hypothetical protein
MIAIISNPGYIILYIIGVGGFFLKGIILAILDMELLGVKEPINGFLDNEKKDFFKNLCLKKNSSDTDEAGPSKKKVKISSNAASNNIFEGLDLAFLERSELKSAVYQLREELDKPSSSKEDKSFLEKRLKAIEEELDKRNSDFSSQTNSSGIGVLNLATATDDEIKKAINEIFEAKAQLDPDSEEYNELLMRENDYEDELFSREAQSPSSETYPSPKASTSNLSESEYDKKDKGKGKQIEKD